MAKVTVTATVKNIKGSPKKYGSKCGTCGESWIGHWEFLSGKKAARCAAGVKNSQGGWVRCPNTADLVGGHVSKKGGTGPFVVPLCHSCNSPENDGFFPVTGDVVDNNCGPKKAAFDKFARRFRELQRKK